MTQPSRIAAAHEMQRRRAARNSLLAFAEYSHPDWQTGAHHREIADVLEAVERGEVRRLIVEAPPRHGKSELVSRRFPAWYLGRNPRREVMSVAYNADLAIDEYGRKVRNIIREKRYGNVFPVVSLSEDSQAAGRWHTNHGGGYIAGGIDSGITGRGAHLLLIDDPTKGRKEANSHIVRRAIWEWYDSDAKTRLAPGAAIILVGTRWHEEDLTGMVVKHHAGENWVRVRLPAIRHEHTEHEEALWPTRYDLDYLVALRASYMKSHPRAWYSLYQQDPQPEKGEYVKREHFERRWKVRPGPLNIYMASDFAVTEAEEGEDPDFTEHGVFGVSADDDLVVLDWWYGQTTAEEWIERLLDLFQKHKPLRWIGEGGVIRRAVEPFMRRRMLERRVYCAMTWINPIRDKATRARGFQARSSMGKVVFPEDAPWAERVIRQCVGFPGSSHDDAFDVMGTMCLAIDDAHAAIVRPDPNAKKPRRRPYEHDDEAVSTWKTI